jgi:hypothetical protein
MPPSQDELATWIKQELMSDEADELNRNKERLKGLVKLTSDGSVIITNRELTSRLEIGLYFVGLAYARIAGLRPNDSAPNKELTEKLGLPEGTVHPKIKELRDEHYIEPTGDGTHRINPRRIGDLLDEIEKANK